MLSHLENLDAAILLGGHSHKQEQREYAEKTYLNPGSLGLALDGVGGHAHFAILTLENSTWQIECFQIPYDLEGYLAEFDRAGQCPCPFLKTDIDLRRELFLSHRKTSA